MSSVEVQKRKTAPPAHPSYKDMIIAALTALKDRKGISRQAIVKYVLANYKVGDNAGKLVNNGLKRGIASGTFELVKDNRARFKLSEATKTAAVKKPAPKKAVAKKVAAKIAKPKKPTAKTTKKTTKPAKKPAKSPKKKITKSPAKTKTKKPAGKTATKKAGAKKVTPKKGVKKPAAKKATKAKK